jgi:E3 Ubiquitin ligase
MLQASIVVVPRAWFVIWPLVGIAAGMFAFFSGFRTARAKRLILNTPASKIRSLSCGLVEISGLASGPHLIRSPFKQVECFYYRSIAWQLKQESKRTTWVKVADESLYVPFYIDDNTDKLLIDPPGAQINLHCDFQEEYSGPVTALPASLSAFLNRHGIAVASNIRVEEYCIKPDDFLFVLGTLCQNPGLDLTVAPPCAVRTSEIPHVIEEDATQSTQQVIRLSETAVDVPISEMTQQQKIAAALARAGIASTPWTTTNANQKTSLAESGNAAAAVATKAPEKTSIGFDLHPPVVLMKDAHQPTFFVSWRSQRDEARRMGWKSGLMIYGGLALALVSIYTLTVHWH